MPENPNADPEAGSEYFYGANITMTTTNANNNNISNNNNNRKQSAGVPRVSSAGLKYYDIATQVLGKKGSDIEELFIAAARDGCYERLENFLQRNRSEYVISVDVKDKKTGNTPLIWAAKRGHAKIVQLLLRHSADITLRNYESQTAVEVASPSIRSILLESVERSTEASHQLLLQAAWQGDIKVVARLLSQKKVLDINCQNADGFTPVMLATRDMQLFERLTTQMSRSYNPVEVVSELLGARADLHSTDEDGKTCLHHAAQSKATIAPSVVATIISGGPNLECKDKRSFTSIHCASLTGNANCISTLLDGGSEVNARGFAGATPLHITSLNNHEKATDVLLGFGANVTATDDRGCTPLDFAKTRKMKKKLQEAWAEVINSKSTTNLGPVRAVSREDLRSSVEDLTKKRKGEVIFEGLPSNPFSDAKKDPVAKEHGLRRSRSLRELSNLRIVTLLDTWSPLGSLPLAKHGSRGLTRHSSLKDKNSKAEEDSGLHFKDPVRKLGQVRNQRPTPIPRGKSRSTERLPAISPDRLSIDRNLESPVPFTRNARSRRSFEDKRGRKPAPLSSREGSFANDEMLERPTPRHHRSGSDPNRGTTNLMDIAASCENYLHNGSRRGRSYSVNSPNPANLSPDPNPPSPPGQRESTVTPVQREVTLMSVCSYRSDSRMSTTSNSPRLLNLGQMLCKSKTPVQNFPFGPTSSKVIPPTPTFLTQRPYSNVDNKSEYDHSPRSDEEADPLAELKRSRTMFKEEFVLEESRPKDPLLQSSSGTDTLSSSGSSRFSSPRDSQNQSRTGAQSKTDKVVKGKGNQSENVAKTGTGSSSRSVNMSVSSKPAKLNEKNVPTMKVSGPGQNRSGSVQRQREGGNSVANANSETATLHAMAVRNAAALNVKTNSTNSKGAKSGGNIVIHGNVKEIAGREVKETTGDANKRPGSESSGASQCSKVTNNSKVEDVNKAKSETSVPAEKENKENKTGTESNVPQKKPGQKLGNVMQVVPTKLTENILRTAPKQGKDKVDEKNTVRTVSSRNTYVKGSSNNNASVNNVNMNLSASAGVNARVDSRQAVRKEEDKAKTEPKVDNAIQRKSDVDTKNSDAKSENTAPATGAKSDKPAIDTNNKPSSSTTTDNKTVLNGPVSQQTSQNKVGNQTNSAQLAKTGNQMSATQANARPSSQARNINMKITRSAGTNNQRQAGNSRKPTSSYTPRFSAVAAQKLSNEKIDPGNKSDGKAGSAAAQLKLDTGIADKTSRTVETKTDNGKGIAKSQHSGSDSSSPTELVPPSVSRSVSLTKSYNMASVKNPLSKSVAISSGDKSTKTDTTAKSVASTCPTTSASISSSGSSSVGKSISPMPAVGAIAKDKTNSLLRSSSMSTIEETKEKKKMSSSDGMIKSSDKITRSRPLSDGSIVTENKSTPKNPPLVEIRTDCSPRINNKRYVPSSVKIQTPVIVNPFAELEQKREEETSQRFVTATEFGFTVDKPSVERSKTQGSIKSRNVRSAKKTGTKDAKPSSASSRISSGRRRRAKSKDPNKSDTESGRPKSGKNGKRVRSGKRKRKFPEANLAKENEKTDVALIGGIGWQLATSCLDKSEADAVIVRDIDSSESDSDAVDIVRTNNPLHLQIPLNTHMQLPNSLETPTSLSSPRFKEVRPTYGAKPNLPCMENDGFPPMNLDMTQNSLSQPNRSGVIINNNIADDISEFLSKLRHGDDDDTVFDDEDEDDSGSGTEYDPDDLEYDTDPASALQEAIIAGKLTPIPESPAQTHNSASLQHVAKTMDAIMKFDKNIQEDDLNKMLGLTPREKSSSVRGDRVSSVNSRAGSVRESSGSSRSAQSKADSASSNSAAARSQGIRTASRGTNQSKTTAANSNVTEKSDAVPKPKSSQGGPSARSSASQRSASREASSQGGPSTRNSASQRSASREAARKSGKISERTENPEKPKVRTTRTAQNDRTDNDNAQVDLKKLLSEKMHSTMKMLEESHSVSRDTKADSLRRRNNENASAPNQVKDEAKVSVNMEASMKLDVNSLQALDSDRKDDDQKSTRSSRRERKFSETKASSLNKEDDIDEAIDEIMSNTFPSRSTLKSGMSYRSNSSTLTEADRSVLKQMSQAHQHSPFYAREAEVRESARTSASYDENVTLNKANPELLRTFHAENYEMGRKIQAMIDAGADTAKVKAMMKADKTAALTDKNGKPDTGAHGKDVGKSESEAKQLVKIMNSFRQMELYAGPGISHQRSSKKETPRRDGEFKSLSRFDNFSHPAGLPPRPGSAGAGRLRKEKFMEIKETSLSTQANQIHTNSAVPKDLAEEFKRSPFVQVEGSYQGVEASGFRAVSPAGSVDTETFERPDSACTTSSNNSSIMEETIQWKKGNVLGKGAFGTVWCGLTSEGHLIAVKQIELNVTNQQKAKKEYEKVQEEVELLKTLEHKNIVGYLGTSLEDSIVSIFMQFVPGGSIASILARFGALDESVFRKYTRQILEGVEYLHSNDVIHRDIKGGNVMLMPNGVIKLIDFGCAKRLCINLSMGRSEILKSMKGTPYWMAPEVVNETGHGKKSDIWSVGCTVFEMSTRKPPWSDMNPMAAIFAIGSDRPVPQLPEKFSEEARDFVNCCLNRDQDKRMSAAELLQSQFIRRRMKRSTTSVS